jgi:deoxyhypusine synthase
MSKGPISQFIKSIIAFQLCALVDAAKGYEEQLANGAKMMVTLAAGAMSTASGKIFLQK